MATKLNKNIDLEDHIARAPLFVVLSYKQAWWNHDTGVRFILNCTLNSYNQIVLYKNIDPK